MEETILSKIKDEHITILNQMQEVEDCTELPRKKMLYQHLKLKLMELMQGEHLSIYKHFREDIPKPIAQELNEISGTEHHQIKEYLQRLNLIDITHVDWPKTFVELKQLMQIHCEIEEVVMFGEAKEDFSREELIEIGTEYEQLKHIGLYESPAN